MQPAILPSPQRFELRLNLNSPIVISTSTGSGKTAAMLAPFYQSLGRVNRAIQHHQKQVKQLQDCASIIVESFDVLIADEAHFFCGKAKAFGATSDEHIKELSLSFPLIRCISAMLARVLWQIQVNLDAIECLKTIVRHLLCIRPIDYIVCAIHRSTFMRHFSRYRARATEEEDRSIIFSHRFQPTHYGAGEDIAACCLTINHCK